MPVGLRQVPPVVHSGPLPKVMIESEPAPPKA